jgi:hypothetical protein
MKGYDSSAPAPEEEQGPPGLARTYESEELGFAIEFPEHWAAERTRPDTVLLSGQDESMRDYVATVNIQVIEHAEDAPQEAKLEAEADHLRQQFKTAENGQVLHDKEWKYKDADGDIRDGIQMLATYTMGGVHYKQLQFVVPGKDPNFVITWAYTNHQDSFDAHLPTAEAMLQSWELSK